MKAVLWDFDGTIVDTEVVWQRVQNGLVTSRGGQLDEATSLSMIGTSMEFTAQVLADAIPGKPVSAETIADELLQGVIDEVLSGELPFKPGVLVLLNELAERGIPCAVVSTSSRRLLEPAVGRIPGHPFVMIVGDEDATNLKPHPEAYLTAAERLGVSPADCLVIEDSVVGSAAGNAAGAVVVSVRDTVEVPEASHRVLLDSLEGVGVDELAALWRDNR